MRRVNIDRILLRRTRFIKGLTTEKLSTLTGIPRSTIAYYELGDLTPTKERFKILCKVLNLREEDLEC